MQTISGVHFNYSFSDSFWQSYARTDQALQAVKNEGYFKILRNFLRVNWWLVLMFGASPAVCNSFFQGRPHQLMVQDNHTALGPCATSLRMGDLGYQNSRQKDLFISPNTVTEYATSLQRAMQLPDADFERIGCVRDGEFQQLSTNLLQIENEYYGAMRPKRNTESLKRPSAALLEQGVEYLEVRLLDLDPFEPAGVSKDQLQVVELLLLYCLMCDSPPMVPAEYTDTRERLQQVVMRGRDPELVLNIDGEALPIRQQAQRILDQIDLVAQAIKLPDWGSLKSRLQERLDDLEQLPSARILNELRAEETSFFDWAIDRAEQTARAFDQPVTDLDLAARFAASTTDSFAQQRALPTDGDFSAFVQRFLAG
jgi:glutamate--cysteine ligase